MEVLFGDVETLVVAPRRDLHLFRSWHQPVYLPQEFVAVPFDEDDGMAWAGHVNALGGEALDHFEAHPRMHFMLMCAVLGVWGPEHAQIAILSSSQDFHNAVLWSADQRTVFGPMETEPLDRSDWPINRALRVLNVDATGHLDELTALGLDQINWDNRPKLTAPWIRRQGL